MHAMKKRQSTVITSLNHLKKVYMIGILGSGMSGLAGILSARKIEVSGSDGGTSPKSAKLKKHGVKVFEGIDAKRITKDISAVIVSLAIPSTHPERVAAQKLGITVLTYPEAVGIITRTLRTISICGTHGKTTTTAMIARTLIKNDFDPTVIVGSDLRELDGMNFRVGTSGVFVLESCEYKEAFLNYHPSIIVLNNLDPDHLDYFKTYERYVDAFKKFCDKLPRDGYLFANIDDEDVHTIIQDMQKKGFPTYNTFTYSQQKYAISDFYLDGQSLYHRGNKEAELSLIIPGAHNRCNALAAYSVCRTLGANPQAITEALNGYAGAARRFELRGILKVGHKKIEVIDDYGHHPEEISATLQAAREKYGSAAKICVVFQPHQYSRTRLLFDNFVASLGAANTVLIPNIYEARDSEADKKAVSAEKLVKALNKAGTTAIHTENLEKTAAYLGKNGGNFDAIICMGAGDVWKVATAIMK